MLDTINGQFLPLKNINEHKFMKNNIIKNTSSSEFIIIIQKLLIQNSNYS